MITKVKFPTPVKVEPQITVTPSKVDIHPQIHVAPSEAKVLVQTMPAPKVDVQVQTHKPCSWVFDIDRDKDGSISRIIASPK